MLTSVIFSCALLLFTTCSIANSTTKVETDSQNCAFVTFNKIVPSFEDHQLDFFKNKTLQNCFKKGCSNSKCNYIAYNSTARLCILLSCNSSCTFTDRAEKSEISLYRLNSTKSASINSSKSAKANEVDSVKAAKASECTATEAARCGEHEICVISAMGSAEGYACNCLSGFMRNADGMCSAETGDTPPDTSNKTSQGATKSAMTVSLGDDKVVPITKNSITIQGTVIPAPAPDSNLEYRWTIISKPKDDVSSLDHQDASATLDMLSPGTYVVQLEVVKDGMSATDQINIIVESTPKINKPPVAVITPNPVKVILPNSDAVLSGADSFDDTGIASYFWKEVKRPSTARELEIDNSDPSNQILQLRDLVPGEYTVSLTVTDKDGASNTTSANITVIPATDYPPTANAGPDQVITLPVNSITLYGNESTDDKQIVAYKWQTSPESASLAADMTGTKSSELKLSNLEAGTYTFILEVKDDAGQTDQAQVHVIVEEPRDKPPKAVINPSEPRDVFLPDSTTELDASLSSDDNGIQQYSWAILEQPPGSVAAIEKADEAVTKLVHLTVQGSYTVQVEVSDVIGQTSTATLQVTVHPDTNMPPNADAGPDIVVRWPVDLLAVSGEGSTDDGEIVKWLWSKTENAGNPAAGKAVNQSMYEPVLYLTGLVPGNYVYQLTVQDVQGAHSEDTVLITVLAPDYLLNLIELRIRVGYSSFLESALRSLIRNLAVDLGVQDEEVIVMEVGENREDGNTFILFYVFDKHLSTVKRGLNVRNILRKKLQAEPKRYNFDALLIDTYVCQNNCSGHGKCNSFTKECECDGFWMENVIGRHLFGLESNCDWSVLYFVIIAALVLATLTFSLYCLVLYTNLFDKCSYCSCRTDDTQNSKDQVTLKNGFKLSNGSIANSKKLRKRRKRLNNNEYVEVPTGKSSSIAVEVNMSTEEGSSDELFTAKPNGFLHKPNGSLSKDI